MVLSKRLPEDFQQNTLLPHLESQLLDNIHVYTPAELTKIARAYAKMPVRQRVLIQKLSDTIKFRIKGFEVVDIVDALGPMDVLIPDDVELFEVLGDKTLEKLEDLTALNLIGIIRVYNKRASEFRDLLDRLAPRLVELLRDYEASELSEMLMSMAQSREAHAEVEILGSLLPEIERRYTEVSLAQSINNVWALAQLKVVHTPLLQRVAQDLAHPVKSQNLTPRYMCRVAWVYRRCQAWDMVSSVVMPLIKSATAEFNCSEFARLGQALPEEREMLERIAGCLVPSVPVMGRKEFMFFFVGCIHGEVLEEEKAVTSGTKIAACLQYIREEEDNFKRDEVERIVWLLNFSRKYRHLLDLLPASWQATKEDALKRAREGTV